MVAAKPTTTTLLLLLLLPSTILSFTALAPLPRPTPTNAYATPLNPALTVDGKSGFALDPTERTSQTAPGTDNPTKLSASITDALAIRAGKDSSLPAFTRNPKRKVLDYQHLWKADDWEKHISRWRYVRHACSFGRSRIVKRTAPMLGSLLVWTSAVIAYNRFSGRKILLPLNVLTLFTSFVAFLLTLRTNHSLSRLLEGRLAWGRCVLMTRNLSQLIHAYIYPVNPQLGLQCARHLSLFGWTLKARMRVEPDDDVIDAMLEKVDGDYVKLQRKRPVALLTRIRQVVAYEAGRGTINDAAHKSLEADILELNRVYGMCERIRMSPIPPMYTRHNSRLIVFWLLSLPVALDASGLGVFTNFLVTYVAGFMTLGLDEISMQLEQPFRLMPMHQLSMAVMRDVADPFTCPPPPLGVEGGGGENGDFEEQGQMGGWEKPSYWVNTR